MIYLSEVNVIVSLICVPVLIAALIFVLYLLLANRGKKETLARLLYDLQNLINLCDEKNLDAKKIKKIDSAALKCELACEKASFEQKQDMGLSAEKISAAKKITRAMTQIKMSETGCARYIEKVKSLLTEASDYLRKALGITASDNAVSLNFFDTKARSEKAKKYLESVTKDEKQSNETDDKEDM